MLGMMEKIDQSLGKIIDALEKMQIIENTIIVFSSDNGGNMYDVVNEEFPTNNYPLSFGKGNIHEGGTRVPCMISWSKKIEEASVSFELVQSTDF